MFLQLTLQKILDGDPLWRWLIAQRTMDKFGNSGSGMFCIINRSEILPGHQLFQVRATVFHAIFLAKKVLYLLADLLFGDILLIRAMKVEHGTHDSAIPLFALRGSCQIVKERNCPGERKR